jgi:hypothetical protein
MYSRKSSSGVSKSSGYDEQTLCTAGHTVRCGFHRRDEPGHRLPVVGDHNLSPTFDLSDQFRKLDFGLREFDLSSSPLRTSLTYAQAQYSIRGFALQAERGRQSPTIN